jgi:hypothetical protein
MLNFLYIYHDSMYYLYPVSSSLPAACMRAAEQLISAGTSRNVRTNSRAYYTNLWSVSREWQPLLVAAWCVSLAFCASFCIIIRTHAQSIIILRLANLD